MTEEEETQSLEQSLIKLNQLAKGKTTLEEFTKRDRYHLLDLFVNNEQTLSVMFEALFPMQAPTKWTQPSVQKAYKDRHTSSVHSTNASIY